MTGGDNKFQPDFIAMIAGQNVTNWCSNWELNDVEDGMSTLTIEIKNEDGQFSGLAKIDEKVSLNFGYENDMSGKCEMNIKKFTEGYTTNNGMKVIAVGVDCTEKLSGNGGSGNFNKGVEATDAIKKLFESAGIKCDLKGMKSPKKSAKFKYALHNMRLDHAIAQMMDRCGASGGGGGGGGDNPISSQEGASAPGSSSIEPNKGACNPGGKRLGLGSEGVCDADQNKNNQQSNEASSVTINGSLQLKGVPILKAKQCVDIQGVGEVFSGKWYVKNVHQKWSVEGGYHTSASLLRGGLGKGGGGGGGKQPMVFHANIYKSGSATCGERQINGDSQGTFTFGDGTTVVSFEGHVEVQQSRGGGEKTKSQNFKHDDPKSALKGKADKVFSGGSEK